WGEVATAGRLAAGSLRAYEYALRSHLVGTEDEPAHLAHLTVREVKVSTIHRRLSEVAAEHGEGAAKMARQVLRSVLGLAVRHDAITANPVREVGAIKAPRGKAKPKRVEEARGFTPEERDAVVAFADFDRRSVGRDLGDLVAFLAGSGARIGEACALRWSALDLDKGTATLGPVVVRTKGEGLSIQEDGKTKAATRTVHLSPALVARLMARQVAAPATEHGAVFTAPRGGLRDPSNTAQDFRDLLTDVGREVFGDPDHLTWATSHTFRKTVATVLHEAGVPDVQVSNHLGHSRPSMTQDVYLSRRETPKAAASLL
ncbi:MAG: site-specific integrase, partial [Actinomycetota bacterium]|nr:site-specific integrase [Actinomycetota bacterium]